MMPRIFLPLAVLALAAAALGAVSAPSIFHSQAAHEKELTEEEMRQQITLAASASSTAVHIPILIYHNTLPDSPAETRGQRNFNVPPDVVEQQFQYLKDNGYTVISIDEMVKDIKACTTTPVAKPVVLTFDDGWRSQIDFALPLLQKYDYTATFFINTQPLDGHYSLYMKWDDVLLLQKSGMTIGDHTVSHPHLGRLSPATLQHEVMSAKSIIEQHIGRAVVHFASPYGYTSDALVALLKQNGFEAGRTTYKGGWHSAGDLLKLTAILVPRDMQMFAKDLQM